MKTAVLAFTVTLLLTPALAAQEHDSGDSRQTGDHQAAPQDPLWQFWVKGNGQLYENFFQATDSGLEEDVTAFFGEAGTSLRLGDKLRAYGSVNYLHYDEEGLDPSTGVRVGLRSDAQPHSFDIYGEQLFDRPSFDVGDQFDQADIRTIGADYAYRFSHDWQFGVDGELQQQKFDITESRDNDFAGVGGSVRWRGSRLLSPEVGVRFGSRDVDDEQFSYDQRDVYLQVRSSPSPKLYLSARVRDRRRDYNTTGREDKRRQLAVGADYSMTPNLVLNLYGAHETTDVNLEGRDFDTTMWLAGLTWKF